MTKHAVVGLSTSLRFEAERFGVSVSVVCPGVVDTPILEHLKMLGMEREAFFAEQPIELYPVEKCAEQVLRGVERRKDVIPIVPQAKFVWRLHRFLPRLNALLTRRSVARNPLLR
jgi:short-subunit dehydrogenase